MDSALYTRPYTVDECGSISLPNHVQWKLLPRYVGVRENDVHIIDERITVVLHDGPNRFWPVIVKMSVAEAEQLQVQLADVIAERKRADGTAA
jgi:hypothetical protein